jgi:hypothetical protein
VCTNSDRARITITQLRYDLEGDAQKLFDGRTSSKDLASWLALTTIPSFIFDTLCELEACYHFTTLRNSHDVHESAKEVLDTGLFEAKALWVVLWR